MKTQTHTAGLVIGTILVPIDFSDHSKNALRHAVAYARQFNAELLLLYVVEPAVYPADLGFGQVVFPNIEPELGARGKKELDSLVGKQVGTEVRATTLVRTGKPSSEIIDVAREKSVDLIIIATHGHSGVEHLLFGSTAEKVVRKAHCPVLVVR